MIVSANQLSLYGAVAEICEEYETCVEVEEVISVLTPFVGGVAQVFIDLLVELLVAEVEEGEEEDRQEEGLEVESGVGRVKERQPLACMARRWGERCKTQLEP